MWGRRTPAQADSEQMDVVKKASGTMGGGAAGRLAASDGVSTAPGG